MKAGSTTQIPAAKSCPRSCTNAYRPLRARSRTSPVMRSFHGSGLGAGGERVETFELAAEDGCDLSRRCVYGESGVWAQSGMYAQTQPGRPAPESCHVIG